MLYIIIHSMWIFLQWWYYRCLPLRISVPNTSIYTFQLFKTTDNTSFKKNRALTLYLAWVSLNTHTHTLPDLTSAYTAPPPTLISLLLNSPLEIDTPNWHGCFLRFFYITKYSIRNWQTQVVFNYSNVSITK